MSMTRYFYEVFNDAFILTQDIKAFDFYILFRSVKFKNILDILLDQSISIQYHFLSFI